MDINDGHKQWTQTMIINNDHWNMMLISVHLNADVLKIVQKYINDLLLRAY